MYYRIEIAATLNKDSIYVAINSLYINFGTALPWAGQYMHRICPSISTLKQECPTVTVLNMVPLLSTRAEVRKQFLITLALHCVLWQIVTFSATWDRHWLSPSYILAETSAVIQNSSRFRQRVYVSCHRGSALPVANSWFVASSALVRMRASITKTPLLSSSQDCNKFLTQQA